MSKTQKSDAFIREMAELCSVPSDLVNTVVLLMQKIRSYCVALEREVQWAFDWTYGNKPP